LFSLVSRKKATNIPKTLVDRTTHDWPTLRILIKLFNSFNSFNNQTFQLVRIFNDQTFQLIWFLQQSNFPSKNELNNISDSRKTKKMVQFLSQSENEEVPQNSDPSNINFIQLINKQAFKYQLKSSYKEANQSYKYKIFNLRVKYFSTNKIKDQESKIKFSNYLSVRSNPLPKIIWKAKDKCRFRIGEACTSTKKQPFAISKRQMPFSNWRRRMHLKETTFCQWFFEAKDKCRFRIRVQVWKQKPHSIKYHITIEERQIVFDISIYQLSTPAEPAIWLQRARIFESWASVLFQILPMLFMLLPTLQMSISTIFVDIYSQERSRINTRKIKNQN
jgi:hypothetical protein